MQDTGKQTDQSSKNPFKQLLHKKSFITHGAALLVVLLVAATAIFVNRNAQGADCSVTVPIFPGTMCLTALFCAPDDAQPGSPRPWESGINVATYSTVNTVNRNLLTAIPIVNWSGLGPDMNLMFYHNSGGQTLNIDHQRGMGFSLGSGWTMSYSGHIVPDPAAPSELLVFADDGTRDRYKQVGGVWTAPPGVFNDLTENNPPIAGTRYTLKFKDQSKREYDVNGLLTKVIDALGNTLTVTRDGSGRMNKIEDASTRVLVFTFDTNSRLEQIQDPLQGNPNTFGFWRAWNLEYDTSDQMNKIIDTESYEIAIDYIASPPTGTALIRTISDKYKVSLDTSNEGSHVFTYWYDTQEPTAARAITDPLGLLQQFETCCVECGELQTTYTNRRGAQWIYRAEPEQDDPYVQNGPLAQIEDPFGKIQGFFFDGDNLMTFFLDELNHQWAYEYDANGNLTKATDPVGVAAVPSYSQLWAYDIKNNLTSYTDGDGHVVNYEYQVPGDPSGTLLSKITEPATTNLRAGVLVTPYPVEPAITLLEYDLSGSPGPGGCTNTFNNCQYGNLSKITDPNGVVTKFTTRSWGQQWKIEEGDLNGNAVLTQFTTMDEGSRPVVSQILGLTGVTAGSNGSSGGFQNFSPNGNKLGNSCLPVESPVQPLQFASSFPVLPQAPVLFPNFCVEWDDADVKYDAYERFTDLDIRHSACGSIPPTVLNGRSVSNEYDALNQPTLAVIDSDEYDSTVSIPRDFIYDPSLQTGLFKRTGPDGMETVVQLDLANRVQSVTRGEPGQTAVVTANYTYLNNGLVQRIDYGNGTKVEYTYDDANRVKTIEHFNSSATSVMRMIYIYNNRDLPTSIVETSNSGAPIGTTTFIYDDRGRLITEQRTGGNAYTFSYAYDLGGNRRLKIDYASFKVTEYFYDIDAPTTYNSNNNRLMKETTSTLAGQVPDILLYAKYYYYNFAGNVTRVVSESFGQRFPIGFAPPRYNATRYVYGVNGRTVVNVLGEKWNPDGNGDGEVDDYIVTFAREYRYDGARQRYLDRELDPAGLMATPQLFVTLSETWTDYDGDNTYGDFTVTTDPITMVTTVTKGTGYELGTAQINRPTPTTFDTLYAHNDHLGTLRAQSNSTGFTSYPVHTAFGEDRAGQGQRYSYAGAFGYQKNSGFSALHVGARYYDPSSGRFLQRDPIGIRGGLNVYTYVRNGPTIRIDPDGLRYHPPAATGPPDKGFTDGFWSKVHYTAGWGAGKVGMSFWATICAAIRWERWEPTHWPFWDESDLNRIGDIFVAGKGWIDAQF